MKKYFLWIIIVLFILFFQIKLKYGIDMDVKILSNGSAFITETWDVQSIGGRDWCRAADNLDLDGYTVSDFEVYMDGNKLEYVNNWGISTIFGTKGFYGYKRKLSGIDLCFGTNGIKRHTFTVKYKITNYINGVNNGQIIYKKLISNNNFDKFSIKIRSDYYDFDTDMNIKEFGLDSEINIIDDEINIFGNGGGVFSYISILGLLPEDSFNSYSKISNYNTYEDYLKHANDEYSDYLKYKKINDYGWLIILIFVLLLVFVYFVIKYIKKKIKIYNGYGYRDNVKIDYDNIKIFRDIPFDKDIYYAYTLIKINRIGYDDCNIIGAIILKWINEKKICINNKDNGYFIDLTLKPKFDDELEFKLFNMMYEASMNGLLEINEFHDWAKRYDARFLSIFSLFEDRVINLLKKDMHIYHRITKDECISRYVMDEKVYEDSLKLYGLKKYLEEFSKIDSKEVIEVKFWDEYLMYACLFGIADEVSNQLKHIHPDVEKIDVMDLL